MNLKTVNYYQKKYYISKKRKIITLVKFKINWYRKKDFKYVIEDF